VYLRGARVYVRDYLDVCGTKHPRSFDVDRDEDFAKAIGHRSIDLGWGRGIIGMS